MEITVKKQRQMSFRETLDFCVSSILHRFSRSLLTLSVVILAVAFFMYLQCDNFFRREIRGTVRAEVQQSRAGAKLASLLFSPYSHTEFVRMIAGCDDELLCQLGKSFSWDDFEAKRIRRTAVAIAVLEGFFKELPPGKLQIFLAGGKGLSDLEKFSSMPADRVIRQSRTLGINLPMERKDIEFFMADYPASLRDLRRAEVQWKAFQRKLCTYAGIRPSGTAVRSGRSWMIGLGAEQELKLQKFLAGEKFLPDRIRWEKMMEYLKIQDARDRVSAHLALPAVRQQWRRTFGAEAYTRLDEKLAILDRKECRAFGGALTDSERSAVARATRERLRLNALQESFMISETDLAEEDHSRQIYLMTLAFFVCVIGITNAMLMSITERFSEIATLKCLGATDFFILVQIVLESLLQGILGGIAGIFFGFLAAVAANFISAGSLFFGAWNFVGPAEAACWSLAAGIVLAILSSIYPAVKASCMAPMEAMRVQ